MTECLLRLASFDATHQQVINTANDDTLDYDSGQIQQITMIVGRSCSMLPFAQATMGWLLAVLGAQFGDSSMMQTKRLLPIGVAERM